MSEILVGVDGSAESRQAADQAIALARALGAEVLLTCVVSMPLMLGLEPVELSAWDTAERERARKVLDDLAAKCRSQGVKVDSVIPSGSPAEVLASMAESPRVEMVAIGHRGRGALARTLLGSVADRLVQISPKPVLVVR
jgi:nucleotide-binding universal stress UspA family protein